MSTSSWSTQQLAEFVAAISVAESEAAAGVIAVELVAEALDADVAVIACAGGVVASVGYPDGTVPAGELELVTHAGRECSLEVPGVGSCAAAAAALDHPPAGTLVIARRDALRREEDALLRGMARAASMAMRMLCVVDDERAAREELERLAREQSALRRVATLVARGVSADELFAAVAEELARLLNATITWVLRYEPDGTVTVVGGWSVPGIEIPIGERLALEGEGVAITVKASGLPVRTERFIGPPGSSSGFLQRLGARAGVGSPIVVDGVPWGVTVAAFTSVEPLAAESETRITRFTELVATAIANTEARTELRRFADEQEALRRLATLVARGVSPGEVLQAVTREVLSAFDADGTMIVRLEGDGEATVVAHIGALRADVPVGSRWTFEPPLALAHVLRTGRPTRVDDHSGARDGLAELVHTMGIQSTVASPIVVEGRLWGAIGIGSESDHFPPDTEQRMVDFTELLATAIANAEAHAALTASRARVVAAADETRRRIERDLHDGAQQRLVSLALQLRAAQAALPSELDELAGEIDTVAAGLTAALEELREFAHGIHPAILAEGGLPLALETLARRSPVPVELTVGANGRLAEAVEVAAYYVVSEALANAAKHARASRVAVEIEADAGLLHVCVRDDGVGGAGLAGGSGLVGLKDRVEALGGRIMLQSHPGAGTTLSAELPLEARATVGAD